MIYIFEFDIVPGKTDEFYRLSSMTTGDPIDKLALKYEPDNNMSNNHLDALWHSGPLQMFSPENISNTETVSLIRNTNDITIGITRGSNQVDLSKYNIQLIAANSIYDYKNNFGDGNKNIIYHPCADEEDNKLSLQTRLHTLRFVKDVAMPFSITEQTSGKAIEIGGKTTINLIDYLLKSKPEAMGDQEYLDRRYQWDINIRIGDKEENGYIALSITINNWTYWFQPTDMKGVSLKRNYGTIKDEYNYQHKIFGKCPAFDNICFVCLLLYKRERNNRRTYLRRRKDTNEY